MLKSLYPLIDWSGVRAVGFDMDGTLYDEAEFIAQVYRPIADILSRAGAGESAQVYSSLIRRWFEKGSSYNRIFGEALAGGQHDPAVVQDAIDRCLAVFRGFAPSLQLPARVSAILDEVRERFPLFLVSDGSAELQGRKFAALGLDRWFQPQNVGLCGRHGSGFGKPATRILEHIDMLSAAMPPSQVVFFGDRAVDAQFAANAGFQFVQVHCMRSVASPNP